MQIDAVSRKPVTICPSCGEPAGSIWGIRDGHEILKCESCEMLYFNRPIEQQFDYEEYYPYLAHFDEPRFEWEMAVRRRKYKAQLNAIKKLAPDATTILDVGAGPGYFCRVAIEEGWKAFAVEPSKPARMTGKTLFQIEYVDLDALADASIDVISCQHVLEHIEHLQNFLRLLRRKLRLGGLLVVHVPNQEPLSFYLRNALSRGQNRSHSAMYYPIHINGFTARSLRQAVERQALKSISIFNVSMWSNYYDPFFLANYFRNEKSILNGVASAIKHAARCAVDSLGNAIDRGDWIVGYFRAVEPIGNEK